MLDLVQRLEIWLAVIGTLIGFVVFVVLIWIIVAIYGN